MILKMKLETIDDVGESLPCVKNEGKQSWFNDYWYLVFKECVGLSL